MEITGYLKRYNITDACPKCGKPSGLEGGGINLTGPTHTKTIRFFCEEHGGWEKQLTITLAVTDAPKPKPTCPYCQKEGCSLSCPGAY